MIELDTLAGILAFSLALPVLVLQLLCSQYGNVSAAKAYASSFAANSRLQEVDAAFGSSNPTPDHAQETMRTLFGDAYTLSSNASAVDAGDVLASRMLVIGGTVYYAKVYRHEIANYS